MPTIRGLQPNAPTAPNSANSPNVPDRSKNDSHAVTPLTSDRIDRSAREDGAAPVPYLTVGADLGFLLGLQASVTIAGGKLYGSIGEFTGLVPGIGASLETGEVRPHASQSVASTIEGTGFTASAGFGIGAQATIGNAGTLVGAGLTTPTLGVGVTQSRRLLPW